MPELNLKPMRNKCIVEPISKYGLTQGGIYTTSVNVVANAKKEIPTKGLVLKINGETNICPYDTVYLRKYFWKDFTYDDRKLLSVKIEDILAGERRGQVYAVRDTVVMKIDYAEKIGTIIIPDNKRGYRAEAKGQVISVGPDYKYGLKQGDTVYILRMEDAFHEGFEIDTFQGKLWSVKEKWLYGREERETI